MQNCGGQARSQALAFGCRAWRQLAHGWVTLLGGFRMGVRPAHQDQHLGLWAACPVARKERRRVSRGRQARR